MRRVTSPAAAAPDRLGRAPQALKSFERIQTASKPQRTPNPSTRSASGTPAMGFVRLRRLTQSVIRRKRLRGTRDVDQIEAWCAAG